MVSREMPARNSTGEVASVGKAVTLIFRACATSD